VDITEVVVTVCSVVPSSQTNSNFRSVVRYRLHPVDEVLWEAMPRRADGVFANRIQAVRVMAEVGMAEELSVTYWSTPSRSTALPADEWFSNGTVLTRVEVLMLTPLMAPW